MIRKTLLLLTIVILFMTNSIAQTSVWKVEANGNKMYIGGTSHLLRSTDYPLPLEFDSAFKWCDMVVFEADLAKMEDPIFAQEMMTKSLYGDGKTLESELSESVYNSLKEEAAKLNIPIESLSQFKPSMVLLTLSVVKMQQLGITTKGVDKHFYDLGKAANKEFGFLETMQKQMDLITGMGEGDEDEFVRSSIKDFDMMDKYLEEILTNWRDGLDNFVLKQGIEMKRDFPKVYKSILVDRNNNWMPKLEAYMQDEKTEFVMAGLMHMHGEDGLIKQLTDKGYKVEHLSIEK